MAQLSTRVGSLRPSAIRELDRDVFARPEVRWWRLNIGQPDLPPPACVLEAIAAYRPGVVAYGPASGLAACREAAAGYLSKFAGAVSPEQVAITQGGSEALLFALAATCDPGDEVLVFSPFYTNDVGFATVLGLRVRSVPLEIADGFALPPDAVLDAACTPATRAVLVNNPNNPTGAVWDRASIERLAAWASRRGLWIVADEVYRQIWFDRAPESFLSLPGLSDRVIVVDSVSKTWSLCGLRLGMITSRHAGLMEAVERLGQSRLGAQPLAQIAAIPAFGLDDGYYTALRETWRARVEALVAGLARLEGVVCARPAGAFYAMASLPVDHAADFARFMVHTFRDTGADGRPESVVVAPGAGFVLPGDDRADRQIRLAAVYEPSQTTHAIEVLGRGLKAYQAQTR